MLKIFENFNETSVCKICGTNKPGKAILIPIAGTDDSNGNCKAEQIHLDCLNLMWTIDKLGQDIAVIYQIVNTLNGK